MTKQIKSAFSLLLAIAMVFAAAPGAFAAVTTSKLPTGNSDGRLIEASMSIRVGNDVTMDAEDSATYTDGAVLADGFHFAAAEILNYKTAADISGESDSVTLSTPNGSTAVTGTRTLDITNNTIEFEWEDTKSVRRLEMWVWPVGAIKDYEIQYFNGTGWEECSSGTFDQNQPVPVLDAANYEGKRAVSYIMTFDEVNTKKLRFIARSFKTGYTSAKIGEAVPRSNNNVNLLGKNTLTRGDNTNGWLSGKNSTTNGGHNAAASPYALNFACSAKDTDTYSENAYNEGKYPNVFPAMPDNAYWNRYVTHNAAAGFWYAVRLTDSPQKVNKVTFKVAAGAIRKFEIWCNTAAEATITTLAPAPSGGTWQLITTVTGNFEGAAVAEAYIPNTVAAEYWMIKITDYDSGSKFNLPGLYVESELSELSIASAHIFDTLETDTEYSDIASERIENLKSSFTYNGNEYTASWESSDTSLVTISEETANIAFHEAEEEVSLTATVNATNDNSLYYSVSKSFTLLPRENECIVTAGNAVEFEDGTDTSLLTDGFFFSSYDRAESDNITPSQHPEKFAKITENDLSNQEEKYIEYEWNKADKVKRLDLWIWPMGAIEEYIIETSSDGDEWTPHSRGNVNENVLNNNDTVIDNQAVYYPILFDEIETQYLRLKIESLKEGVTEAYIAEAMPKKDNNISFTQSPDGAEGIYKGYSHYMESYVVSNTSDESPSYRKSSKAVWPAYSDGSAPDVTPNATNAWYATGFGILPVKINRVTVPIAEGNATEIELLCAAGEDSGFDMDSAYPTAPDTNAQWKTVATVRGEFNSLSSAVIDIADAPSSKYWMVRVKKASSNMKLGRVGFYIVGSDELSPLTAITNEIFSSLETDFGIGADRAKTKIYFNDLYEYKGKEYAVEWESSSELLKTDSGEISEHDNDEVAMVTAIIKDTDNPAISYCISKKIKLVGMLSVSVFRGDDSRISELLTDGFTYSAYNRSKLSEPKNAIYNPDKFEKLDSIGSGIEFHWEKPRIIKRVELWAWPVDAISAYEIQVSSDGESWTTHYTGTIDDQYAQNPSLRPADTSDSAGTSSFYPIVFDEPTENVCYFRFVVTGLRDETQGAYIAEILFKDTNDVNYIGFNTIPGTENTDSSTKSHYTKGYYLSDTTNAIIARKGDVAVWPIFSNGSLIGLNLKPREGDLCWYATSFQGAPVAVNKVTLTIAKGTVYEYEVMCATKGVSGFEWADYPPRPDTVKDWKSVARVSGQFTKENASEIHFDNDFASKFWMIKITQASDDLQLSRAGLYTLGKYELNKSSFVLGKVFDNVSDTALDTVINEKMNIPQILTIDEKEYEVFWIYDDTKVNSDGTLIPSTKDSEMLLTANIGAADENYKHVLEKKYSLMGKDERVKTILYTNDTIGNISLSGEDSKVCDVKLQHGFTYLGKKETDITFGSDLVNGKLQFMAGEVKLLELAIKNGSIIVNEGNENEIIAAFSNKIRIDIENDTFSLYKLDGADYQILIYKEKLLSDDAFDSIKLLTSEGEMMSIDTLSVKAVRKDLFDAVREQFDFSKISSYKATNLNGNLTLINKVADINLSYEVGDSSIISIEDTPEGKIGRVNLSTPAETTVTVTGINEDSPEYVFEKTFAVITGKQNVAADAISSSPAAGVEGKTADMASDGNLESEFVTNAGKYRVNLDLKETKAFNKIRIYEANTSQKIQSYNVFVSSNNVDYQKVYTGTEINSNEDINVGYNEARFIRVEVTSVSDSGTGIREICAYNEMSDSDKLQYDYNALTEGLTLANNTVIPKKGKFGTEFTLSSDNGVVSITETENKENWKVTVGTSQTEVTVNVTLTAKYGSATSKTKSYQITVLADTNIRDNVITEDSNTGSGGSGGGGGGGGSRTPSNSVAFTPDAPNTQNSYTENELTNHWGSNEIKTLISRGIVQGDGKSLNLTKSVTRAEFCKMIITALGYELIEQRGTFYDVMDNDWFSSVAETAFEYGIMSGDKNGFRGNDTISRQEMAVVIVNALKAQLANVETVNSVNFTDGESVALWANEAVKLAAGLGILNGYDTGDFKPEKELQRDEAMVVVYRVLSHIGK